MKVVVDGKQKIFIESDSMQYILRKYEEDKEGELKARSLGYFRGLPGALKFVLNMKIKESTANEIKELIKELQRIEKEIEAIKV